MRPIRLRCLSKAGSMRHRLCTLRSSQVLPADVLRYSGTRVVKHRSQGRSRCDRGETLRWIDRHQTPDFLGRSTGLRQRRSFDFATIGPERALVAMAYTVTRNNRFHVVSYDGIGPTTSKETD